MADGSRPKLLSLDAARADRLYLTCMQLLESYCETEVDSTERARAIQRFYGGDIDLANLPEAAVDEFLDWFAFSYRLEESGERVVERFGEEHQVLTGQSLLPGLYTSRFGFYLVEKQRGYHHDLLDCLTGESLVLTLEGDVPAPKGTLFCGRLIKVGERWRTGFTLDTLPGDLMRKLRPILEMELARMRLAFPEATWADLLSDRWPLLRDMMMLRYELETVQLTVPTLPPVGIEDGSAIPRALDVGLALQGYAKGLGLSHEDTVRLLRLWYDAAALLKPRIQRPETWAAGAAWVFHAQVDELPMTQAEIAEEFGLSAGTAGQKGRQIMTALQLIAGDDRYIDPLMPAERMKRLVETFGPDALTTLFE